MLESCPTKTASHGNRLEEAEWLSFWLAKDFLWQSVPLLPMTGTSKGLLSQHKSRHLKKDASILLAAFPVANGIISGAFLFCLIIGSYME